MFRFLSLLILGACGPDLAEVAPETPQEPAAEAPVPPVQEPATKTVADRVDLNASSQAQFLSVPGVTEKMAHEFEEYRPYVSIRQFRKQIGKYVDEAQIAAYEQHVYVPVAFDACDQATLLQLPGLDEAAASDLIAGRPYGTVDAFAAKLAERVTPAELAIGRGWLRASNP